MLADTSVWGNERCNSRAQIGRSGRGTRGVGVQAVWVFHYRVNDHEISPGPSAWSPAGNKPLKKQSSLSQQKINPFPPPILLHADTTTQISRRLRRPFSLFRLEPLQPFFLSPTFPLPTTTTAFESLLPALTSLQMRSAVLLSLVPRISVVPLIL